jgi:hypothetical protein
VTFDTLHGSHCFRGTIAAIEADNLVSHLLGGFKAPSRSLRFCRQCMATPEDIGLKVYSDIAISHNMRKIFVVHPRGIHS